MYDCITLTFSDIRNIISQAQNAGKRGEFVYGVVIHKPTSATQSQNSAIGMEISPLSSGSSNEPVPYVTVI